MRGIRLTKRVVDAARYEGPGGWYLWHAEIAGFGLRVYPSGRKSFVVTYRVRGKQRFFTIGRFGEITVDQARTAALETLARARRGEDPSADRQAYRRAPTVADLAARFMKEHALVKKKPRSAHRDQLTWNRYILPRFGTRKVADLDRADVAKLHSELGATPVAANQARGLLSTALNLAEIWAWRPEGTNPCRHVPRYKTEGRERFLSEGELGRLSRVLREAETSWATPPNAIAGIRLLILTGCRPDEILTLRWDYVDVERRCLNLPDSKTGKKTVWLNSAALEVLAGMERVEGTPYVIPGSTPGTHRASLHRLWSRIRKAADLPGVRLYDLRHTFASTGVNAGLSLKLVGALLGHTKVATTERYAHLADDPVREVNERIGAALAASLNGE
jgi:integrase